MQLCRWAIAHLIRFNEAKAPEALKIPGDAPGCASWKFGPDAQAPTRANRAGSDVWCGIASFPHLADAQAAFENPQAHVPGLSEAREAWQALLLPTKHRGECNHLDSRVPGLVYEATERDPGGPLLVVTTAGFNLRSRGDFQRLIDFRRRVDRMREVIAAAQGSVAHQVFAPQSPGDDEVTISLWRDEQSMSSFAYRPGSHSAELDRQVTHRTLDRSSFTRFRIMQAVGRWNGVDPALVCNAQP